MRWSSKPHVTTTPTTTVAMATPPLTMPPPTATPRLSTSHCRSPTAPCLRSRSPRGSLLRQPTSHHVLLLPAAKSEALAAGSAPAATAEEGLAGSLQGIEVFDLSGKAVPIVDLWKDRKVVVAFARHFGCVLCRKRADLLASKQDVMEAADVALALIGPGTVDQAKAFSEQTKFRGEVYADPNHSSYDALKFACGVTSTFTPLAGLKIIQLYMEGYRQDWELSFQENTLTRGGWQQGGLLVAGPGIDNILYIHKDKEAGDDPDLEDVLRACCS